jgi:hypothetical protein
MSDREWRGQKGPQKKPVVLLVPFEDLQWFDCVVERVGPGEDGTIWVNLTDSAGGFTGVWFMALVDIEPQVLATALVAIQTGCLCQVALTGTDGQSQIYRIHLIAASK